MISIILRLGYSSASWARNVQAMEWMAAFPAEYVGTRTEGTRARPEETNITAVGCVAERDWRCERSRMVV